MKRFAARATALFALLLIAAGTGVAATALEFYLNLLRRGISNYQAGRYDAAARDLDVAAFGLVESVDHFETAKVYAALANDRLGRTDEARLAAQRVLAGERVQRRFAELSLPSDVRSGFLAVARKYLSPAEVAALTSNAPVPAPQATASRVTRATVPPRAASQPARPQPQPAAPQPQPAAPQTQPVTPQTQPVTPQTNPAAPQTQPATPQTQPARPTVQPPPATTPPRPQKADPAPQPEPKKPEPRPETPKVETPRVEPPRVETPKVQTPLPAKPQAPTTTPAKPARETPRVIEERTVPFPPEPDPQPKTPPQAQPGKPQAGNIAARLAEAERLLRANELFGARAVYRELIETNLDRASLLAVAEGAYRARDFGTAVRAFDRVGTLNKGEEPYRYYLAVALYETGQYRRAKRELAAALPYIEVTDSVARYRAKIEGAID